jgi:hypothetical protein
MASSDSDRFSGKSTDRTARTSGKAPQKAAPKAPMQSQKLTRTIQELESAFTDWESLSSTKARAVKVEEDRRKSKATEQSEKEFRKKTKKLLKDLREQLAELTD